MTAKELAAQYMRDTIETPKCPEGYIPELWEKSHEQSKVAISGIVAPIFEWLLEHYDVTPKQETEK